MLTETIVVGVLIGLGQLWKEIGLNTKLIPVINILIGVSTSVFLIPYSDLGMAIYAGAIMGLTSCGLYSGSKAFKEYLGGE